MSDNNDGKKGVTGCRLLGRWLIVHCKWFVGCFALTAIVLLFWQNSLSIIYGISSATTTVYATALNLIWNVATDNGSVRANETVAPPPDVSQFVGF